MALEEAERFCHPAAARRAIARLGTACCSSPPNASGMDRVIARHDVEAQESSQGFQPSSPHLLEATERWQPRPTAIRCGGCTPWLSGSLARPCATSDSLRTPARRSHVMLAFGRPSVGTRWPAADGSGFLFRRCISVRGGDTVGRIICQCNTCRAASPPRLSFPPTAADRHDRRAPVGRPFQDDHRQPQPRRWMPRRRGGRPAARSPLRSWSAWTRHKRCRRVGEGVAVGSALAVAVAVGVDDGASVAVGVGEVSP